MLAVFVAMVVTAVVLMLMSTAFGGSSVATVAAGSGRYDVAVGRGGGVAAGGHCDLILLFFAVAAAAVGHPGTNLSRNRLVLSSAGEYFIGIRMVRLLDCWVYEVLYAGGGRKLISYCLELCGLI